MLAPRRVNGPGLVECCLRGGKVDPALVECWPRGGIVRSSLVECWASGVYLAQDWFNAGSVVV